MATPGSQSTGGGVVSPKVRGLRKQSVMCAEVVCMIQEKFNNGLSNLF